MNFSILMVKKKKEIIYNKINMEDIMYAKETLSFYLDDAAVADGIVFDVVISSGN